MARGIALLAGVKDESNGGLGCEHDVDNMAKVLSSAGKYEFFILKTEQATRDAILDCIKSAGSTLVSGDMFVFYFSGHGGQTPDVNGDEKDHQDETLCTYASQIVDDDLAECWKEFAAGVRIVMLSDCCHSGTSESFAGMSAIQQAARRRAMQEARKPIRFAAKTSEEIPGMKAQLIHFGACRDDQESVAGPAGGAFTLTLVDVWEKKNGKFSGYEQLCAAITASLEHFPKHFPAPQLSKYGDVQSYFLNSKPFSI